MGPRVSKPERKIVLLGRTGDGKSSAGNTILGKKVFNPKSSETQSEIKPTKRYGRKITIIETPGFFETDHNDEKTKSEIIRALVECASGVDAFVFVLKIREYTEQELKMLNQHLKTLKEDVFDHTVILFTFGKELKGQKIEEFLKANSQLQELVDQCGGRCHVIDNKHWKKRNRGKKSNRAQVKKLLNTIDEISNKNGCFTNELFQELEEQIQHEMENITEDNLKPEEKREKAKKNVQNKLLVQAAGAMTGALFGALLGAAAALSFVLGFLQTTFPLRAILNITSGFVGAGDKKANETTEKDQNKTDGTAEEATGEKAGAAVEEKAGENGNQTEDQAEKVIDGGAAAVALKGGAAVFKGALGGAAVLGGLGGAVAGWKAAEEADSVYDAMIKAAENTKAMFVNVHEFVTHSFNNKTEKE